MHSERSCNVPFLILFCLPASRLLIIESEWGTFCQIENNERAVCYVNCFEDIMHLSPKNVDLSLISGLVVFQNSNKCDRSSTVNTFQRFKNLREFHYMGAICPFSRLPNISKLSQMQIQIDSKGKVPLEVNNDKTAKQTLLPNMKKLTIERICCGLFGGNFVAPQLEELKFHCLKKHTFITGFGKSYDHLLHFTVPRLKRLDFIDNGLGFPVSYVANLPELNFLSILKNSQRSKTPPPQLILNNLNLSSLEEIIYIDPYESDLLQCLELGDVNLTQVYLDYHNPTCSSVWRCPSCHPDSSNNNQNITIVVNSNVNSLMSQYLPNITLNTTDLVIEHSPLLIIDSKAMSRFSRLRRLQVKSTESEDGKVLLHSNPFKSLRRPMEFRFLRLSLLECDCLEYNTFSWLKTQNPQFEGEIECSRLPPKVEKLQANQWIKIADFLNGMENVCSPISSEDILSTLVFQRTSKLLTNGSGNLTRHSFIMSLIYFLFKLF